MRARNNAGKRRQGMLRGKTTQKPGRLPGFEGYDYDDHYLMNLSADDLVMMGTKDAVAELNRRHRDRDGVKFAWAKGGRVPKNYRPKKGRNSPDFRISSREGFGFQSKSRGASMRSNPGLSMDELNRLYIEGQIPQREYLARRAAIEAKTGLTLLNPSRRAPKSQRARRNYALPGSTDAMAVSQPSPELVKSAVSWAAADARADLDLLKQAAEKAYRAGDLHKALNALSDVRAHRTFKMDPKITYRPTPIGEVYLPAPWEAALLQKVTRALAEQRAVAGMQAAANPRKSRSRRTRRR